MQNLADRVKMTEVLVDRIQCRILSRENLDKI
jgi:hypothetical protein